MCIRDRAVREGTNPFRHFALRNATSPEGGGLGREGRFRPHQSTARSCLLYTSEVCKHVIDKGGIMMPGTASAGEMQQAMNMGCEALKLSLIHILIDRSSL